mmetsp:Transcript_5495/g.15520  ORF Transcript_5495/g.15520 Transcript_5495/m.15520 type:complete len:317 (-) Transcript_5495:343-1293(-)
MVQLTLLGRSGPAGEELLHRLPLFVRERGGEMHIKVDKQVSLPAGITPLGKALAADPVDLAGLDDARTGGNNEFAAVEMGEDNVHPAERLGEGKRVPVMQVLALVRPERRGLLLELQDEIDVAGGRTAGRGVSLALEYDSFAHRHAWLHIHLQDLGLHNSLLPLARLALVLLADRLALTKAGGASRLLLHDHVARLLHRDLHPAPAAVAAVFLRSPRLQPRPVTDGARHVAGDTQLSQLPHAQLLQRDRQRVLHGLPLPRAPVKATRPAAKDVKQTTTSSPKELLEQVRCIHVGYSSPLEAILTILVIHFPLFLIV